ncbi:MAG: hypothetical protein NVS2B16_02440 [Chloroflexota bacterium]
MLPGDAVALAATTPPVVTFCTVFVAVSAVEVTAGLTVTAVVVVEVELFPRASLIVAELKRVPLTPGFTVTWKVAVPVPRAGTLGMVMVTVPAVLVQVAPGLVALQFPLKVWPACRGSTIVTIGDAVEVAAFWYVRTYCRTLPGVAVAVVPSALRVETFCTAFETLSGPAAWTCRG